MLLINILIEYALHSLNRPFTYIYKGDKKVVIGTRVLISFNHKQIVGYVIGVTRSDKTIEELEEDYGFVLEEIDDVLDDSPLLNEELMNLADEISEYYLAPKISVLQAMLPLSFRIMPILPQRPVMLSRSKSL